MKRFLPLMIACLCLPAVASAKIYSWTDAQGNVVFSDQKPPPGVASHTVDLKPLPTVPAAPSSAPNADTGVAPPPRAVGVQEQPVLRIVSPENEQSVRANNGDITLVLQVSPSLQQGQLLHLYLDGKPVYVGKELKIPLSNLDRGRHQAYVVLNSASGQVLRRSTEITFYVLRHSILFKKPAAPSPSGQ